MIFTQNKDSIGVASLIFRNTNIIALLMMGVDVSKIINVFI